MLPFLHAAISVGWDVCIKAGVEAAFLDWEAVFGIKTPGMEGKQDRRNLSSEISMEHSNHSPWLYPPLDLLQVREMNFCVV